jgi:hypothetical protein
VAPTSGDVRISVTYIDRAIIAHSPTPPALPPGD